MKTFPITCSLCLVLLSCYCAGAQAPKPPLRLRQQLPTERTLTTIAFGSCNRESEAQEYWSHVARQRPELWIWLGDNIYGDTRDMNLLREKYLQQKYNSYYSAFRGVVPVIGTWDDHDYGVNDGGRDWEMRKPSQELLLDFLDVPASSPVRKREGVYQSYTFGPAGKRVKIILLDTRYFRDKLEKNTGGNSRYKINAEGDVLGEAQWAWLERELRQSDAQVHLIGTSIQVIPNEHGFEKWGNFPKARKRLLDLLAAVKPAKPVLLSGDRHLAELSRLELPGLGELYEFTSSGLTHSYEKAREPNALRVGEICGQKNFGILRIDWSGASPKVIGELYTTEGKRLWAHAL